MRTWDLLRFLWENRCGTSSPGLDSGWGAIFGSRSWERPGIWGGKGVDTDPSSEPSLCEPAMRKLSRAEAAYSPTPQVGAMGQQES